MDHYYGNRSETEKRAYWVHGNKDGFTALFRNKNPKTGQPWQAMRQIVRDVATIEEAVAAIEKHKGKI